MLHLVINNRTYPEQGTCCRYPASDQSKPRNQLRATIFGHRCTDKDVLLKGESSSNSRVPAAGTLLEGFSAPDIIYQLNQEKHFRVWKNLALHLIEQMGYVHKSNCV